MRTPIKPVPDYCEWLKTQETFLRNKEFDKLDLERLTAEIAESISRVEGQLSRAVWLLLLHLTKWTYQPRKATMTNTMEVNIRIYRKDVEKILLRCPSLVSLRDTELGNAYRAARKIVLTDNNMSMTALPEDCPWTPEQIFNVSFFPSTQTIIQ